MWVSQTYLGCPDPDAKVFVYYLWEDYKMQKEVPKSIVDRLTEAGRAFGKDVSLFAPISGTQHEIRNEIRSQGYDFFWQKIGPNTPGLLLTYKPLGNFDPREDEYLFFHLPSRIAGNEEAITKVFGFLHDACVSRLSKAADATQPRDTKSNSGLLDTVYEALQLKLTFGGLGIDFKPIISRFRRPQRQ